MVYNYECENEESYTEDEVSQQMIDFIDGYIERIEETFCPHCKAELIHELSKKMYDFGCKDVLLSLRENIDNAINECDVE